MPRPHFARLAPSRPGRSRLELRALLAPIALVAVFWSKSSAAQASSWLFVGGGAGRFDSSGSESLPLLHVDTGIGTSANHPVVLGGLFRLQGYFGEGVDLAALARLATRGFARGDFGVGLDAGVYQRWWGIDSTGFVGNLVLGAPWGITLVGGATMDSEEQRLYFASLGIDFARLTVHRHTGLDWFANPMRSPSD